MNELTSMTWSEWIDMNKLKSRNWNEWKDRNEWIETNDLTLPEKTLGFAPESVFSGEFTRSRSLTHDDVVDMMVRQLAVTIVRNSEVSSLNFLWWVICDPLVHRIYPLPQSNTAMECALTKWRFIAGKIIEPNGRFPANQVWLIQTWFLMIFDYSNQHPIKS